MLGFGLYQTLSAGVPETSFNKTSSEKLYARINEIIQNDNENQIESVFMLICEHARLNNEFVYSPETNTDRLPYLIQVDEKSNVIFDLNNLPDQLKHILLKYVTLLEAQKEELRIQEQEDKDRNRQ